MELITLLSKARDAGFEFGSMLTLALIYWRLSKQNRKHWDKLIATLRGHDQKYELRFTAIETHVGIKKIESIPIEQ